MFPQSAHIASKRGVFHYRRRLPTKRPSEVTLSLGTRDYREAQYLAGLLDDAYERAAARSNAMSMTDADIRTIARTYLSEALERDTEARTIRRIGQPIYTSLRPDLDNSAADLDAEILTGLARAAQEALEDGDVRTVQSTVAALAERFHVPPEMHRLLALGILEAHVVLYQNLLNRSSLNDLSVLNDGNERPPTPAPERTPQEAEAPVLSKLVDGFVAWRRECGLPEHTIAQERPTLRCFLEIAGDKPPRDYTRSDVATFLENMRQLPKTYGKSPQYRDKPIFEIIAIAKEAGAPRLSAKTAKRHLSVLTRLFKYCADRSLISITEARDLTSQHETGKKSGPARSERDAWTMSDLKALFASPVWTGCHPHYRSRPGPEIIRDGKFWLPLLALFHGCRLEEFADLCRRDVRCDEGIHFVRLTTERRKLKNANAERIVPLHPEIVRIDFLVYVEAIAPEPDDPLFPDLEPRGADRKRGPNITKWFGNYRKEIGLYRPGVGMHAFRHTANTQLRNLATGYQQIRHIDYLFGHSSGGGEGAIRYDKGPQLRALASTLALLNYPELDFSRLYNDDAAGEAEAV